MNILIITPYYTPDIVGGAEISSQLMAESLASRHSVTVLTIANESRIEMRRGVKIVRYANQRMLTVWNAVLEGKELSLLETVRSNWNSNFAHRSQVKEYFELLKKEAFDVAVMNTNEECFGRASLWKALHKLGIPAILTLRDPMLVEKHIGPIDVRAAYCWLIRRQMRWIRAYAAPSEYMLKIYEGAGYRLNPKRIICNAVDVACTNNARKHRRIVYAGSIVKKKGIQTLISAFEALRSRPEFVDIELYLIGRTDASVSIETCDGVKVIPWMERKALYQFMGESWCVVLPSEWPEAFGRIVIEAIYSGTLAVESSAGAIPEIFGEKREYLFQTGDAEALRTVLERILTLTDAEYARELAAMQEMWKKYSIPHYAEAWESYIQEVSRSAG